MITNRLRERKKEDSEKKPTRYFSHLQEKHVAEELGGRATKNSGATMFGGKGDVHISNLFSIECKTKTSDSDSISIKKEWLKKIKEEALFDGKPYYALAFNFGPNSENYYAIDESLFHDLVDFLKANNE